VIEWWPDVRTGGRPVAANGSACLTQYRQPSANFVIMAHRLITSRSQMSRLRPKLVCTTPIITESRQTTIDYSLRPRKMPPQSKSFWNWLQHVKKSPMRSTTVAQADNQICHRGVLGHLLVETLVSRARRRMMRTLLKNNLHVFLRQRWRDQELTCPLQLHLREARRYVANCRSPFIGHSIGGE
jgi:hypothetical protein